MATGYFLFGSHAILYIFFVMQVKYHLPMVIVCASIDFWVGGKGEHLAS